MDYIVHIVHGQTDTAVLLPWIAKQVKMDTHLKATLSSPSQPPPAPPAIVLESNDDFADTRPLLKKSQKRKQSTEQEKPQPKKKPQSMEIEKPQPNKRQPMEVEQEAQDEDISS